MIKQALEIPTMKADFEKQAHALADEAMRCMSQMQETGEFPSDTCPADLFTLTYELKQSTAHPGDDKGN